MKDTFAATPPRSRARIIVGFWLGVVIVLAIPTGLANGATGKTAEDFVVALPLEGLVTKPANLFNLEGKTLRFTPQKNGGYTVESLPTSKTVPCDQLLRDEDAVKDTVFEARGWAVPLAFSFPFAGKTWQRLYVNRNGNISFEKHEGAYWPRRNPWPDGGMCSVAAAIDSNSAAGMEQMLAVLWNAYETDSRVCKVHIESNKESLAITWEVVRGSAGQEIAGTCTFQARLYPSGMIEMAYPTVPERDGIVGLFSGQPVNGVRLHHWQSPENRADPSVAIESTDIYDDGSVLKFVMTMKNDVPAQSSTGTFAYRCMARINGDLEQFAANLHDGWDGSSSLGASPRTAGFRIQGRTVEFYVSKVQLYGIKQFAPSWNVIWWGTNHFDHSPDNLGTVDLTSLSPPETHLLSAHGSHSGNIFEVFHYSEVTKSSDTLLKAIYQKLSAKDDIALVFTDFRIDDLFSQGGGARWSNFPIQGIGPGADTPRSTKDLGSTQLQANIANVWVGAPLFAESGETRDGWKWQNYARGVCWISHETTHRWGMNLTMRNPQTGQEVRLGNDVGHWEEGLNAPAMWSVADRYLERPAQDASIMGGAVWKQNSDNTFSKAPYPYGIPNGLTALDLYIMGLLPPEKVPDTFILTDLKDVGRNRFQAKEIPVRIQDIVAAMGPRLPASAEAQKIFHLKLYLVHEAGRPVNPEMLSRAKKLAAEVSEYFNRASGGVMKVVPSN